MTTFLKKIKSKIVNADIVSFDIIASLQCLIQSTYSYLFNKANNKTGYLNCPSLGKECLGRTYSSKVDF